MRLKTRQTALRGQSDMQSEKEREREWKREHTIVRAVRALSLRGLTSLSLSPSPDAAACCQARAKATAIF